MMIQSKTNIEDPAFLGRNHLSISKIRPSLDGINNRLAMHYICRLSTTNVVCALQINSFMQNKANFQDAQMNVNNALTKAYENKTLGERGKNKANSKPNKANLQNAQINVNFYSTRDYENKSNWAICENKANTNPIKPNFRKAKMKLNFYSTKDKAFSLRISPPIEYRSVQRRGFDDLGVRSLFYYHVVLLRIGSYSTSYCLLALGHRMIDDVGHYKIGRILDSKQRITFADSASPSRAEALPP
jgi:hypothetical protein